MKNNAFSITPPIVQSALAGIADIEFCQRMLDMNAGMVTLGGFSIDLSTQDATIRMVEKGRNEFILPHVFTDIENWCKKNLQLRKKRSNQIISINTRLAGIDKYSKKWLKHIDKYTDFVELNAHCRQMEIIKVGGGQMLLKNLQTLDEILTDITDILPGSKVGIKIRGHVLEEHSEFINIIENHGICYIHIDAMVPGANRANLKIIRNFVDTTDTPIIGNNSVRSFDGFSKMLETGCVAISIARSLIEEPEFMRTLITEYIGRKNENSNNYSL